MAWEPSARAKIAAVGRLRRASTLVLAGALAGSLLACGSGLEPIQQELGALELPPAELEGVVFEGFRAGVREVELRAETATVDANDRTAQLDGVEFSLAGTERGDVRVRAREAELDLATDDFVLRGQVRGQSREGERFTTSEIRYDAADARLWTRTPVRVERSNLVLRGDGMEMDLEAQRLKVLGHVRTEVGRATDAEDAS